MSERKRRGVVVAGGTGGHINSALSVGLECTKRGVEVAYYSGSRPLDLKLYSDVTSIHLPSSALRGKSPLSLIKSIFGNLQSFLIVLKNFLISPPDFVLGAGGYVCGPVLLAGKLVGAKIYILEQNSVIGLTNKILSKISKKIFTHFTQTKGISPSDLKKIVVTGNPVRKSIQEADFTATPSNQKRVLIFGGSLGALSINNFVSELIKNWDGPSVSIRHQTGMAYESKIVFKNDRVAYEPLPYLDNIALEYKWADLIICRAGASSLSELMLVGKPVLLIPFPHATDDHQTTNAKIFKNEVNFPVEIIADHELNEKGPKIIKTLLLKEHQLAPKKSTQFPEVKILNEILKDL